LISLSEVPVQQDGSD